MTSFNDLMNWHKNGAVADYNVSTQTPEPLFSGDSLTKDDLLKDRQYLRPIREYMIERKGVDYRDKDDATVVDDFVQHMRYFNSNSLSTAAEMRFISKADQARKDKARRAYEVYDNLGNVFVNDGVFGAADGVKDYILAGAKDPTNYLGLLTGGIGRAAAAGVQITGKKAVNEIVRRAALEAAQSGAGREAAKQAGIEAGKIAAKRAVARGATSKAADRAAETVAKRVAKENRRALAKKAANAEQQKLFGRASKKALLQTTALDSGAAVLMDVMAQRTLLKAGAQENYSALQTGFSSLLGGVAGAAQLGFGKFRGASNLAEDTDEKLTRITNRIIEDSAPLLNKVESKKAAKVMTDAVDSWADKVNRGSLFNSQAMPSDLVSDIMFGDNYKSKGEVGGLLKIFKQNGIKFDRKKTISDVMTNVARNLDEADLIEVNKKLALAGLNVGDMSGNKAMLGDMLAAKISDAGSTLNVMSQMRRTLDASVVASQELLDNTVASAEAKDAIGQELKRAQTLRYGQSVWKRMLVSSPATTAINVFGFGQFYIGSTMADIFNSGYLGAKGLAQMYTNPKEAKRTMQQARALTLIQGQKMRNFLDPFTTHDEYMKFLNRDENKNIRKILFETYAGGVDTPNAVRYNIDPDGKAVQITEAVANASAQLTGVKIQDSFTKSQMFMTEMDKYLRMSKNMTLKQALNDDGVDITEDVIQAALDSTLKSVYAKDYTTNDQLLGQVAKLVETASNIPGIGFVIPFGRFMNNVVASAYQWSPLAGMSVMKDWAVRTRNKQGISLGEQETFGRWLVGTTALTLAMDYDEERQNKGLGVFEIDAGGGTIVDAKNTFPFSIFLAAGRVGNQIRKNETVSKELIQEMTTQLAVGQVAKDVQFGNDLMNLIDTFANFDQGQRGITNAAMMDAFYKATGNVVAGVTRPVDFVNKLWGFAAGNDSAKDVRQADGMNVFTQSATKYVDNILESFIDKTDTITGEQLRVATREGEVYDPNPLARVFGLRIKQGRTAVEKAYSLADMHAYTASERTKVPEYDKVFNTMVAPILEREVQRLLDTPAFKNGSLDDKRELLKQRVSNVKKMIRKRMEQGYGGNDTARLRMAAKLASKKKPIKNEAMKMAKEQFGIEGKLEDLEYREIGIILDYVEYLESIYRTVAKI